MTSKFNCENRENRKKWTNMCKIVVKSLNTFDSLTIDPKRNVNLREKEQIWNGSETHRKFDSKYFRIDILGNICIKGIHYNNNEVNKVFACEYEHLVSHSNGGQSTVENVCLLNAGINRSKSKNEVYTLNYYHMKGLCSEFGLSGKELITKLQDDLHYTCKKYDLYFSFEDNCWTIKRFSYNGENKCKWPKPSAPVITERDAQKQLEKVNKRFNFNNNYNNNHINNPIKDVVVPGLLIFGSVMATHMYHMHNRN